MDVHFINHTHAPISLKPLSFTHPHMQTNQNTNNQYIYYIFIVICWGGVKHYQLI